MTKIKEFNIDLLNLENKIIQKKKIKTYLPEFNIFLKVAIDLEIDFQLVAQYEKIVQLYINYLPEIKKIIILFEKKYEIIQQLQSLIHLPEERYIKHQDKYYEFEDNINNYIYKQFNNSFSIDETKSKRENEDIIKEKSQNFYKFYTHVKNFELCCFIYYKVINYFIFLESNCPECGAPLNNYTLFFTEKNEIKSASNEIKTDLKIIINYQKNEYKKIWKDAYKDLKETMTRFWREKDEERN